MHEHDKYSGHIHHKVWIKGAWSGCTRACGVGHRFRLRQHVWCSHKAVVRFHVKYRESQVCNTRPCNSEKGELMEPEEKVVVPEITAASAAPTISSRLRWRCSSRSKGSSRSRGSNRSRGSSSSKGRSG